MDTEETLTPQLRAEIESLLRSSPEGLEHGQVFLLSKKGLSIKQIAAERRSGSPEIRKWIRSLESLFAGKTPTSPTAAMTNSYVYRYFLWCGPSPELLRYAHARLRDLQSVNPKVSMEPMRPRDHKYATSQPSTRGRVTGAVRQGSFSVPDVDRSCPDCGLRHVGECPWG
jgi:hypothetical protein